MFVFSDTDTGTGTYTDNAFHWQWFHPNGIMLNTDIALQRVNIFSYFNPHWEHQIFDIGTRFHQSLSTEYIAVEMK
jgi:hypothetical protein